MNSKIKVNGIPAPWFIVIFLLILIGVHMGVVPDNMGGGFALCLVFGVGLMWLGDHTPVLKDYGLGTILCVLVPAILLYMGLLPQSAADIAKNFFSGYDFTSFLVPGLLVGSILAMDRRTLLNAGVRFILPMVLTIVIATAVSGLAGAAMGYGMVETMLYIAGPILGSGVSASAVPLSEIYAQYGGGDAASLLTTLTSSVMVANISTILIACILAAIGNKTPDFLIKGFAGRDGKLLRKEEVIRISEEEKEEVRQQIRFVKEHRKLIMTGNFYRLISPFEGDEAAWVVVSEDRTEALAGYYRQRQPANGCYQRLRLSGLDPEAEYQVSGFEGSFYGDELMQAGLVTSDEACGVSGTGVPQGDYQSRVFYLKKL